jgi:hypothetical protein
MRVCLIQKGKYVILVNARYSKKAIVYSFVADLCAAEEPAPLTDAHRHTARLSLLYTHSNRLSSGYN